MNCTLHQSKALIHLTKNVVYTTLYVDSLDRNRKSLTAGVRLIDTT